MKGSFLVLLFEKSYTDGVERVLTNLCSIEAYVLKCLIGKM